MVQQPEDDRMKLLRIAEVAEVLDVSRARAYELVREGLLPVVRLGRQIRVDPTQLEAWLVAGGTRLDSTDSRKPLEIPER